MKKAFVLTLVIILTVFSVFSLSSCDEDSLPQEFKDFMGGFSGFFECLFDDSASSGGGSAADGLEYELVDGCYAVTGYTGDSSDVVIPESYRGLPVTSIKSKAFYDSAITSVIIPSSVVSIGHGAFEECGLLESITLPFVGASANGERNTHFGFIFGASEYKNNWLVPSKLKSVILTGGSFIDEYSFYNCSHIEDITIPATIKEIKDYAFSECDSLEKVFIFDVAAWCNISFGDNPLRIAENLYMVGSDTPVTSLIIPEGVTAISSEAFYNASCLKTVSIPNGVTEIGTDAFMGCSSLESINIPSTVSTIGVRAFYECKSIKSIMIPSSVTVVGASAFS